MTEQLTVAATIPNPISPAKPYNIAVTVEIDTEAELNETAVSRVTSVMKANMARLISGSCKRIDQADTTTDPKRFADIATSILYAEFNRYKINGLRFVRAAFI
jgi:hypothetical protein